MIGLNVEGFGNEYDTALGMARQGGHDTIDDLLEGLGAPDKNPTRWNKIGRWKMPTR
jgi:hypothetical protein